jgi:hypothetical protein
MLRNLVARYRRSTHDHEARQFQIPDEMLGGNSRHQLIALVEPFPLVESQPVGEGLSEVIGGRWGQFGFIGHERS